jgi:hypothetical protein
MATGERKTHTYRFNAGYTALSAFNIMIGLFLLVPGLSIATMALVFARSPKTTFILFPIVMFGIGLMMMAFALFMVIAQAVRYWFTYVRTSPAGIEYLYGWNYGCRAAWSEVDRLGEYTSLGFLKSEVLFLRRAEPNGFQLTTKLRRLMGLKPFPLLVPVGEMAGWPSGGLADDLRHYAPQLFSERGGAISASGGTVRL